MHPVTRGEDYMANLQDGWLVFESGREKRRLEAPYPANWNTLPIPELEDMCRRASPVRRVREKSNSGQRRAVSAVEIEKVAIEQDGGRRTFRSPNGREWTVRVHECLDRGGEPEMVLRFTADDIVVELAKWPETWREASVEEFALMLLDANPPRRLPKGKGPQRRQDDRVDMSNPARHAQPVQRAD
ncbi:MAG TPA: hypothetical protein VM033_02025 [Gemmatimonadaceae bacterium]|nr:hypothetical protein [Gemmatimonadaceae bacterium]